MEIDVATAFSETQLDPRITAGIVALWSEQSTREVVEQAASFQLNDSAPLVPLPHFSFRQREIDNAM